MKTRMPKIGIRPTIDGRRKGVRESLEEQTMNMAKAAAALIESNLRYPNGEKVQCVIAPSTIGGVAEASACAELFAAENVTATLTVTPCWCYGSETMDTQGTRNNQTILCPDGAPCRARTYDPLLVRQMLSQLS